MCAGGAARRLPLMAFPVGWRIFHNLVAAEMSEGELLPRAIRQRKQILRKSVIKEVINLAKGTCDNELRLKRAIYL
jgi:hypothetical protein